jgi:hypothetical protein
LGVPQKWIENPEIKTVGDVPLAGQYKDWPESHRKAEMLTARFPSRRISSSHSSMRRSFEGRIEDIRE